MTDGQLAAFAALVTTICTTALGVSIWLALRNRKDPR